MKYIIICTIALSFIQCRYFNVNPVDGIITENLKERPLDKNLIGYWKIDDISYNTLKDYGYKYGEVESIIKDSGEFIAKNFPDIILDYSLNPNLTYSTSVGKWKISENRNKRWILDMNFSGKFPTSYDLYLMNDSLIIWTFIGDPDSGERFLFKKVQ